MDKVEIGVLREQTDSESAKGGSETEAYKVRKRRIFSTTPSVWLFGTFRRIVSFEMVDRPGQYHSVKGGGGLNPPRNLVRHVTKKINKQHYNT